MAPEPEVPRDLVAVNRYTGEIEWRRRATQAAPLVALEGNSLFYFDSQMRGFYDAWPRQGRVPSADPARYLVALDPGHRRKTMGKVDSPDRHLAGLFGRA